MKDLSVTNSISIEDIITYVQTTHGDAIREDRNWGERGLFYNPGAVLPKGIYLLTFKEKDGPNDKASQTDRDGVFRLNLGLSKPTFRTLFGPPPARPPAGGIVTNGHDFTQLDQIMPHPVYGWMSWIGVLNPSQETFEQLKPMIAEAVGDAQKKFQARTRKTATRF